MSASDHLSPEQLLNVAASHAQSFMPDINDKCNVSGECDVYSDHLLAHANIPNARGQWFSDDLGGAHKVAVVDTTKGQHVVDMTWRQFHPTDSVPLVAPVADYLSRLRQIPNYKDAKADWYNPQDDPPYPSGHSPDLFELKPSPLKRGN